MDTSSLALFRVGVPGGSLSVGISQTVAAPACSFVHISVVTELQFCCMHRYCFWQLDRPCKAVSVPRT